MPISGTPVRIILSDAQTALNKNLIMGLGTERHESQVQISESSECVTTDTHAKCTTPYVRALLPAELSQFRAMTRTPTACAAALSAIDKEIDAARRFTHSLLSRRNALAPISVTPPHPIMSPVAERHPSHVQTFRPPDNGPSRIVHTLSRTRPLPNQTTVGMTCATVLSAIDKRRQTRRVGTLSP